MYGTNYKNGIYWCVGRRPAGFSSHKWVKRWLIRYLLAGNGATWVVCDVNRCHLDRQGGCKQG